MNEIPDILARIIAKKQEEVKALELERLIKLSYLPTPALDFDKAIRRSNPTEPVRLIAELKKASPSRGAFLDPNIDLYQVADIYKANGASAISVLTDESFFQGSLTILSELSKNKRKIPLLRKDFIIDPKQIFEARANGADSILLIAAAFETLEPLKNLHLLSWSLGMIPLVEVHNERELELVLEIPNIRIIGVNNRDLRTFNIDVERSLRLSEKIPSDITKVAESGISCGVDVLPLAQAGFDAILVGEKLITADNIAETVYELSGVNG